MNHPNPMHDDISEAVILACRRRGLGEDTGGVYMEARAAIHNRQDVRDLGRYLRAVSWRAAGRERARSRRGRTIDWSGVLEGVNDRRSLAPHDYDVCDEAGRREQIARVAGLLRRLSPEEQMLLRTLIPGPANGQITAGLAAKWVCSIRTVRRRAAELGAHFGNLLGGPPDDR